MTELSEKRCLPCEAAVAAFTKEKALSMLVKVPGWQLNEAGTTLSRDFTFKNFFRTMSFVNAVAHVANEENHHPDFEVGYNYCKIHYQTHAIQGLSENDFICAAKINTLVGV